MSGSGADVSRWLKAAGASIAVFGGVLAATASDDGFGGDLAVKNFMWSVGGGLHVLGWLVFASGACWVEGRRYVPRDVLIWVSSAAVGLGSMGAFWYRLGELDVALWLQLVIALGWLGLGLGMSLDATAGVASVDKKGLLSGLGMSAVMIVSGMAVLPWQRRMCLTEGPGMPLQMLGWVMATAM